MSGAIMMFPLGFFPYSRVLSKFGIDGKNIVADYTGTDACGATATCQQTIVLNNDVQCS